MNFLLWLLVISGVYNLLLSFIMNTDNIQSAFLFKLCPFLFGIAQIVIALNYLDIIKLIIL